jgi:hypothetical protein
MILYDVLISAVLGIVILLVKIYFKRNELLDFSIFIGTVFECLFAGFTIYIGFASIFYSLFDQIPLGLTTIVNIQIIAFFGGLAIMSITLYWIFQNEIKRYKERQIIYIENSKNPEISIERVNYVYSYLNYKTTTTDPELNVVGIVNFGRLIKRGTVQVRTPVEIQQFLCKRLLFELKVHSQEEVAGEIISIPSSGLAILRIKNVGEISVFEIIRWEKNFKFTKQIQLLQKGDLSRSIISKPFIQLKPDYYADKFTFNVIKKIKEGIDQLNEIDPGD